MLCRNSFQPSYIYTDTCPHNQEFWKAQFGDQVQCKLGLFHCQGRIYKTLDNRSELFWQALVSLKQCFYTYNEDDLSAVLQALKDGKFMKTRMNDDDIHRLRHSKKWKQMFEKFLCKILLPGNVVVDKLVAWMKQYKNVKDSNNIKVISKLTIDVTKEQIKKLSSKDDLISDPTDVAMYVPVPPGKRSTHQLTSWKCNRPESGLEYFHLLLAHYGNTGMNILKADTLTLGGICEYNARARW